MQLIEEYYELLERDSMEISFFWKTAQLLFYFIATVAGYISAVLFYVFWQNIFDAHCPLWTELTLIYGTEEEVAQELTDLFEENKIRSKGWAEYVIVNYECERDCQVYLTACFLSCIFGAVWLMMYFMCGKGGYDRGIYDAPWRIVVPSILFNFIFIIMLIYAYANFKWGFMRFMENIKGHYLKVSGQYNTKMSQKYDGDCNVIQSYLESYDSQTYDACKMFSTLEILSCIMIWSWIGALVILIVRIIIITDFRLLKVAVYEIPESKIQVPENQ